MTMNLYALEDYLNYFKLTKKDFFKIIDKHANKII